MKEGYYKKKSKNPAAVSELQMDCKDEIMWNANTYWSTKRWCDGSVLFCYQEISYISLRVNS